ncbi:hypothetical protein ACPYO6_06345 [Georgenia sp. Z1344]|uniref:hypothetical protein n=1 Tax=Georgenia sp. Z1344 TaxID=3416706 RepID=UPI003CEF91EC
MFVVTADQNRSTQRGVLVDEILAELAPWHERAGRVVALPFERTVGDEIQGVLTSAPAAVDVALRLARLDWAVGIGAGPVDTPLAASASASSGTAFVLARDAVETARSKASSYPIVVRGADEDAAESATAVLHLVGALRRTRSDAGWEVSDRLVTGVTQRAVAEELGITYQAVHDRVRVAGVREELAALPHVAAMVAAAEEIS